jgi:hypothetical protein
MNTLITAANSAKAQQLKIKLNTADVILGDYEDLPAFMLSPNLIKLPNPSSSSYAHEMLTLCLDKNITVLYPLRDEELTLLKQGELLFNEYGIKIMKQANELMNQ